MSRTSTTTVPTFVHVPADQAAHPSAAEDWWYAVGHLLSDGHEYGYEVQLVASGISQLSITDITAGQYYTQQGLPKPRPLLRAAPEIAGGTPDATAPGPVDDMHPAPTPPQRRPNP